MNKFILALSISLMCLSCNRIPQIIFDTDIGNDIDDVEALALLYSYMDEGKADLLGICLNKKGFETARFVDIMGTFYGHADIPVGVIRTEKETGWIADECYTGKVCRMTDSAGAPLFKYSRDSYDDLPDSYKLYRKLLSEAKNNSVTIISVGFLNNLSLLLNSGPDEISPLSGMELIRKKVKLLSIMAGRFFDENPEFNVMVDIPRVTETVFRLARRHSDTQLGAWNEGPLPCRMYLE